MRAVKQKVLENAKAAGLFDLARQRSADAVRILCYHGLWLGDRTYGGDSLFMRPETFRARLAMIRRLGYTVVSLDAAVAALSGKGPALPPDAVVITIDDGWAATASIMLPELERNAMPATLYCDTRQLENGGPVAHILAPYLMRFAARRAKSSRADAADPAAARSLSIATDFARPAAERCAAALALGRHLGLDIDGELASRTFHYMTPAELAAAHARGLDVQLHTHTHSLGDLRPATVEREIGDNRRALSRLLARPAAEFRHFCYPSGVTSQQAADALADIGIASATTTVQSLAWRGEQMQLLPRLLDGENLSEIEFEAELAGFGDWLRMAKRGVRRPRLKSDAPAPVASLPWPRLSEMRRSAGR